MPHRQTFFPRFWPVILLSAVLIAGTGLVVHPGLLVLIVGGGVIGFGLAIGRVALWRHRHPILSREELREVVRRSAPLN